MNGRQMLAAFQQRLENVEIDNQALRVKVADAEQKLALAEQKIQEQQAVIDAVAANNTAAPAV